MPSIFFQMPSKVNSGPVLIEVYFDVGESFIIFKANVVVGAVSLYQVALKDEGFLVGISNEKIKVSYSDYHPLQFGWQFW